MIRTWLRGAPNLAWIKARVTTLSDDSNGLSSRAGSVVIGRVKQTEFEQLSNTSANIVHLQYQAGRQAGWFAILQMMQRGNAFELWATHCDDVTMCG